ncbi:hypothetical protein F9Y90_04725 (plasmid) [Borrelia miyamotoi]|uniref:Lipoprotein n=1 Tax=Borrelia miyamotoi TaxID=47466 RepID=A0A5P8AUH5_9SPIR|nr:hypothetical protein [Borrelia miyamotoi]QFP42422.1 hypothetical protein F9Y90_04725 [Borrelia miyamotoi]WAZ72427.1 hypothetical protein O5404_05230 [Borrelia miyamotoi]WVI05347.1 hypothetical protein F9Y91_00580 [Borrelia miyamotoi]
MGRKVSLLSIIVLVLFITSCNHGEVLSVISKINNDGVVDDNIGVVSLNREGKFLEQYFELDAIKEENVNVGKGDIIFEVQNRKKDGIDSDVLSSLENFDNEAENLQWWCGHNEKTLANLYKMSFAARDRVNKFYDIWAKSSEEYNRADRALERAISDLGQIKNTVAVEDRDKDDRIFEAEKKLDIAIDVWKKAREVKQKAEQDCRIADYYAIKIETTIEVLLRSLKLMRGELELEEEKE